MDYLNVKLYFPVSMLEARGLVKFGRFSEEELALYSFCISLDAKLAVSGILGLVADMVTYAKKKLRPNTFVMQFIFFFYY